MPNFILELVVDRVDLVDEGANSEAFIRLQKRKENTDLMNLDEILQKMRPEHAEVVKAEIEKAKNMAAAQAKEKAETAAQEAAESKAQEEKEKRDGLEMDLQKARTELEEVRKSKSAEPDFEEVLKGLPESAAKLMREMRQKQDAAEEEVRKAKETADHEVAVAKAKELKALPVDESKLITIMKSASADVIEVLKAANKAMADAGILTEVGKHKDGEGGNGGKAWAQIEKAAGDIKNENSGMTSAQAMRTAIKQNPELYRQYLDEEA